MKISQTEPNPCPLKALVTGVILAGGQGTRMGGIDKGWAEYKGSPLIGHVIQRLAPQADHILIVANRSIERYEQLGHQVISDEIKGFHGPLAGIHAALGAISTPLALVVPTDAPLLPEDLLTRLAECSRIDAGLDHPVLCHDGEREQPLFGIYPKMLNASLQCFLESGQRRLMQWCKSHHAEWVDWSDRKICFANMNTPAQLAGESAGNEQ